MHGESRRDTPLIQESDGGLNWSLSFGSMQAKGRGDAGGGVVLECNGREGTGNIINTEGVHSGAGPCIVKEDSHMIQVAAGASWYNTMRDLA